MSRWLVTGGAGFIGSHVVERLVRDGQDIVVLDDLSTGKRENLAAVLNQIELQVADIRDEAVIAQACRGIDIILHLAAQGSVPRSLREPKRALEVNTIGTLNVLLAARDAGVGRVVFSSSSSVYGKKVREWQVENVEAIPASPYALSKLSAEQLCRLFSELYNVPCVRLRYFNVFGPRQNPDSQYAAVIPLFISRMLAEKPIEIHGDGGQSRDFTFVDNVVEANLAAARATTFEPGGIYNIACGDTTSIQEVFEQLQRLLKTSHTPIYVPARAGDIPRSRADISKAQRDLGWQPSVRFAEGLAQTVAWYREQVRQRVR